MLKFPAQLFTPTTHIVRYSLLLIVGALLTAAAAAITISIIEAQAANGVYDTDGDKLIEINYLEQLDAIRYDTDGDGWADEITHVDSYTAAFPVTGSQLICNEGCIGYELTRSLDFGSAASYANGINQEWHTGKGWRPILNFQATLDGHGNAISNLYSNSRYESGGLFYRYESGGLFHNISGRSAVIKGIGLLNADVTVEYFVGALVGENHGTISHSYATGSVTSKSDDSGVVGGLVGSNHRGTVSHSYANVTVTGRATLVGWLGGTEAQSIVATPLAPSQVAVITSAG